MTDSDNANDVAETDPTLRGVGKNIDDAKADAREILGERDKDQNAGEPGGENGPDDDLGGAAPVP